MTLSDASPEVSLAGVKVLVAEDEQDTRDLLEALLSMTGAVVSVAGSADEAFASFERERPDIVVSDMWMPGGGGRELIRRIRALPSDRGGLTPAIALSGGSTVEETVEAGFHAHLKKPVDASTLLDCIGDFVEGARIGRAHWSVSVDGDDLHLRFIGYVTATDMRAAVTRMLPILERSTGGYRIVVDLRELTGFDPSVAFVGQSAVIQQRHKLRSASIVGGSSFARLIAKTACQMIGIACDV